MANAWGPSWGSSWGVSWGTVVSTPCPRPWGDTWGDAWGDSWGSCGVADTNSGVQRLDAFHERQDYYREVQRREALQFQQIRLAELQQQQREIEAQRAADDAQRQEAQVRRPKAKTAQSGADHDTRIASLAGELAALNGAIIDTRAEIARLDAIEMQEALAASMREDDETILILAASI